MTEKPGVTEKEPAFGQKTMDWTGFIIIIIEVTALYKMYRVAQRNGATLSHCK